MPRSVSNRDLADKLLSSQVDATTLVEAARRLRNADLQFLLTTNEIVQAVSSSPVIDRHVAAAVETIITSIILSAKSEAQISSIAGRVMAGVPYDDQMVKSLAASVLAHDETPGQD